MERLPPSIVTDAFPWPEPPRRVRAGSGDGDGAADGRKYGWGLVRELLGCGVKAFRRTPEQEAIERRQKRFLVVAGVIGFVWLLILLV